MARVLRATAVLAIVMCLGYIAVNVYLITASAPGSSGAGDILLMIARELWPAFVALGVLVAFAVSVKDGEV